jgi:hypothetical protein
MFEAKETRTAEELAGMIEAELAVASAHVVVTAEPTVGWTATVSGVRTKSFIVQLKADVIAARLRQQFDLQD